MKNERQIRQQYQRLAPSLDERTRREWAASEAMAFGHGGIALVHRACGLSRGAIGRGIRDLRAAEEARNDPARTPEVRGVRRAGGGRRSLSEKDPALLGALEALVEPGTRGDPESPLRWTLKSLRVLAAELGAGGHPISYRSVGYLLKSLGYSLQGNRKTLEGSAHPDRDAQFRYLAEQSGKRLAAGLPVLSVDTKKKELVGPYKNGGREWRPAGEPEEVKVHDFVDELGRASPYGVYDIGENTAWVSVGVSADTAEFAVESLRRWWRRLGVERYADAAELFITADGGGSNSHRGRLWKLELQRLADEIARPITVCHYPPGTSKWNKIEHRLFSFVTLNWRGKPLHDYCTVVELIGATTTTTGLSVECELDDNHYEKGRKISDAQMASINLHRHDFHGDWNYTIKPRENEREG